MTFLNVSWYHLMHSGLTGGSQICIPFTGFENNFKICVMDSNSMALCMGGGGVGQDSEGKTMTHGERPMACQHQNLYQFK